MGDPVNIDIQRFRKDIMRFQYEQDNAEGFSDYYETPALIKKCGLDLQPLYEFITYPVKKHDVGDGDGLTAYVCVEDPKVEAMIDSDIRNLMHKRSKAIIDGDIEKEKELRKKIGDFGYRFLPKSSVVMDFSCGKRFRIRLWKFVGKYFQTYFCFIKFEAILISPFITFGSTGRMLLCVQDRSVSDNHNHSSLLRQFSHGHNQKIEDGGSGSGTRISHFLPASRRIVQFSNGKAMEWIKTIKLGLQILSLRQTIADMYQLIYLAHGCYHVSFVDAGPGSDARIAYINDVFDLFHAGHVEKIVGPARSLKAKRLSPLKNSRKQNVPAIKKDLSYAGLMRTQKTERKEIPSLFWSSCLIGYFLVMSYSTLCDPYLNIFCGLIPPLGGALDLSPILAFLVLNAFTSAASALPVELPPTGAVSRIPSSSQSEILNLTTTQEKWMRRVSGIGSKKSGGLN
ncbi:hypothetical protein GIB67_017235 [Kingdonia uniflora]|uniref:Uncharacterized protein n=1 Tax=Kingdonia uniflora TaxID=39325 RepID=A0A7J7NL44_9MAGN|nr:hypothetical protein GIB67_017235 [Kingdonia uniflora]